VKPNSQLLEELLDCNPVEFTITTSRGFFEKTESETIVENGW
jgi:hypothetical protein